jgi:M6 family metalloprotease-like protein
VARALRRILVGCFVAALLAVAAPQHARAAFGCSLAPQPRELMFGVGAGSPAEFLRPTGRLRAVMLFVDFPDAPASEDPAALYREFVPDAEQWMSAVSYQHVSLQVDPVTRWYRMPRASSAYGFAAGRPTFAEQRDYMADAVAAANPDVDFSQYDLVYVVAARGAAIPLSPAFVAPSPDLGVPADGTVIRYGITFGADLRGPGGWGASILDHETDHTLGLPDLYDTSTIATSYWDGLRYVGGWDVMSWLALHPGLLAWERWRLGWLSDTQVECLAPGSGQVVRTLEPTSVDGSGLKALVAPVSATRAYVLEVRERVGVDSRLCDRGVLLSTVDTSVGTGQGPIRVVSAQPPATWAYSTCGPLWNAPFDLGSGEVASFRDDAADFSFTILARTPDGGYTLRVARGSAPRSLSVAMPPFAAPARFLGLPPALSGARSGGPRPGV